MSEKILIAVAWPYANGSIHLGQVAGVYLPADIFARYHRIKGNEVLMVSGSDTHGTPVTLTAEQRGVTPEDIITEYQDEFLDNWKRLGITFDLFTTTHTNNHFKVVQDIFLDLLNKGYIYKAPMHQPFCQNENRFLADRYVEGICPECNSQGARGDQCDSCGKTLDPKDLINMTCRTCGEEPVIRETEHFFLKLTFFEDVLSKWVSKQNHWRPNVKNFTQSFIENGLKDRAITRDIEWGIPLPIDGYPTKRIYVWFEAVLGYLSASIQWANDRGEPDSWIEYWSGENSKSFYFMGKDNIPFHSVILPSILLGYGKFNLPYDIPANEYLNLQGSKFSTSRDWAVWLPKYLDKYSPDALRYVLSASMPETSDTDFTWKEFVRRNNDELVATYGNLVNRVLNIVKKNFENKIPEPTELDDLSKELLDKCNFTMNEVSGNLEVCQFRLGLQNSFKLAQSANRYLEHKAPWKVVKSNVEEAGTTIWVALAVINCLKILFYPFLPHTSSKLHSMLGFKNEIINIKWEWDSNQLKPGTKVEFSGHLFDKLDDSVVEDENMRMKK